MTKTVCSALMKVCPGSRNLRVMSCIKFESALTTLTSDVRRHQLLFWEVQ
jgi:hypothetical protein